MWIIGINMRKGISHKSQRTFARITVSLREELTCREMWKIKMSKQWSIIKSPLSSDGLRRVTLLLLGDASLGSMVTWALWPLAIKCPLPAEAQRTYVDLPRKSVQRIMGGEETPAFWGQLEEERERMKRTRTTERRKKNPTWDYGCNFIPAK